MQTDSVLDRPEMAGHACRVIEMSGKETEGMTDLRLSTYWDWSWRNWGYWSATVSGLADAICNSCLADRAVCRSLYTSLCRQRLCDDEFLLA